MRNSKKICGQNSVCCFFSLQAIPQYLQVYVLALLPRCKSSLSVGAYSQSTHGMIPVFAGCTALYNFLKKQKMLQSLCLQGFEAPYTTAADRNRTGTGITTHGILSPGRLPVPPLRQISSCLPFSHILMRETTQKRLELSTSAVTGRRSNQLSHWASL